MHLLGGKALFLSSDDIQLGTNETLKVLLACQCRMECQLC